MSRRSSAASLTTSASGSTTDDPLMRDCYDLRRRLLQTEQSIKSLNPPILHSSKPPSRNGRTSAADNLLQAPSRDHQANSDIGSTEPPPVLTLADLSPATSDTLNYDFHEKMNASFQNAVQLYRPLLASDQRQRSLRSTDDDVERCSIGSGDDFAEDGLRKKLSKLRGENTMLVSQNHKLMSGLENIGYELHQERNNVKLLSCELEQARQGAQDYEDRIVALEKEISLQQEALKITEDKLLMTVEELQAKNTHLNNLLQSTETWQQKYEEELKLRKHVQSQLEETLHNVEEITKKMSQDKQDQKEQNEMRNEQLEKMERELNELANERDELLSRNTSLEGHLAEINEENRLLQCEGVTHEEYKSSLERENVQLRNTVARQSQRVGMLEKQTPENEEKFRELIKLQNDKIRCYQAEIEQSKKDMLRLESLVQQVQEQSFKNELGHAPAKAVDNVQNNGIAREHGQMNGLRSELMSVAERNKMNDRKQQELEEIISGMEDEAASYSIQLIELEEKLAEKHALNTSLENKINQQSLRVVDIKTELDKTVNTNSELQKEIGIKTRDFNELSRQLTNSISELGSYQDKLCEVEESMQDKLRYISELETTVETRNNEIAEHRNLLNKTRDLHSEHCDELEKQIEQLQRDYEGKNNQVTQLDTVIKACQQDLSVKVSRLQQLENALAEQQRELSHRDKQSADYEEQLTKLQEKARVEDERGLRLDESLQECQQELRVHIQQLEVTKQNHQREMNNLREVIERYKDDFQKKCEENEKLEKSLCEKRDSLKEYKKRAGEMEGVQKRLQQQVGILELELSKEREINGGEIITLKTSLENAKRDLDERTTQLNELNSSLIGVHKDMKQSASHVLELEQLLQQTRGMLDKKMKENIELTNSFKEADKKLKDYSGKLPVLEDSYTKATKDLEEREKEVVELDSELTKAQKEVSDTVEQLVHLRSLLQENKRELQDKEEMVDRLDKQLNESQELLQKREREITEKDAKVVELDTTVRECQWELKQRTSEMGRLDVSIKEQRSDLKQKANALEHSLTQYQYELSEKTLEVSELKAKLAQSNEQLKQKTARLEYMEKTMKQQEDELRTRMEQMDDFENEFNKLKVDSDEKAEMNQELRVAREQYQSTHSDLLDARRKLLQLEQKEHELLDELQEAHALLVSKEADCTRLAKDLGSAQVREAQAEAKCLQEIRRVEQQLSMKVANYEKEIQQLRENHSKLFSQKEEEVATHRLNTQNSREKEKSHEREMKRLKDEQRALHEHVNHLTDQLNQAQEQLYGANEAQILKESEITRLQAKLSGYERATFGSTFQFGPLESRPFVAHGNPFRTSPNPRSPNMSRSAYHARTPVKRSSSAHDLHRMSTSFTSHDMTRDDVNDSRISPKIGQPSWFSGRSEDNTFESLFNKAREELDAKRERLEETEQPHDATDDDDVQ